MRHFGFVVVSILTLSTFLSPARAFAEGGFTGGLYGQAQASGGSIRGRVILSDGGTPLHNVIVNLVQLRRSTETDENGAYEFQNVPPGTYTILAHMEGFPDQTQRVRVTAGGAATLDFTMRLAGLKEEVTVTATGSEQSVFESFQSVNTVDALTIAQESHSSIGEVLDKEPGIAKRGFG